MEVETSKWLSGMLSYGKAVAPIVLSHVLVPPLSYFRGERPPFPWFYTLYTVSPDILVNERTVKSMTLHLSKTGQGYHIYQWITHMFVHTDYQHLLSNLSAALSVAYPAYREFGLTGLYTLYLSGGLIASMQSLFQKSQINGFTTLWKGVMTDRMEPSGLVDKISSKLGDFTHRLSSQLFSKSCGSSGAVCSLLGCEFALTLRDVTTILYQVSQSLIADSDDIGRRRRSIRERVSDAAEKFHEVNGYRLFTHVGTLMASYAYIRTEGQDVCQSFSNVMTVSERFLKAWDLASINHLAHFQGALYGIAFGVVFGWILPARRLHWMQYI
jgi:membrane associated rhomboid family serine protease